jgi:signal peptide peptidase SppA
VKDEITLELTGQPVISAAEQYFGVWAIAEETFRGVVEHVTGLNLVAHVSLNQQPAAIAAASSRANAAAELLDGVAVVNLSGTLMKSVGSLSSGTSTVNARRQIRQAVADPAVKAILLRIDSPGGTVAGTSDLADEVTAAIAAGKPCYAYVEDLAASAAYWIASQCDKVYSNATAMIGSIGTYMTVQDYSAAAAQKGVKVHVVRAGAMKGVGTPGTEITAEHLGELQRLVNDLNSQFVSAVAKGRKLSAEVAAGLADGRVHVGRNALSLGLVDGIQSFDATLTALATLGSASPISNPTPNTPTRKGMKMSGENAAANETKTEVIPQAASVQQLKAAFPKADAAFLMGQLERSATMAQAQGAWTEHLQAQLDASQAELAKAKKSGAPVLTTGTRKTAASAATEAASTSEFDGDAKAEMSRLVGERMRNGMGRSEATRAVARANPELHRAYLEATNSPKVHALIGERFEG